MITGEPVTKNALQYSDFSKAFLFSKFHLDMMQYNGKKRVKWNLIDVEQIAIAFLDSHVRLKTTRKAKRH